MKNLVLAFTLLALAAPAMWAQEAAPALGDVARASRSRGVKPAKVVTNDDIPSRPPEPPPPKSEAKPADKAAPAVARKADDTVPCPADLLRDLQDQQSSVMSGIEVLKASIAVGTDPTRLRNTEGLLAVETEKLATLQKQIQSARAAVADSASDCSKLPAKDAAAEPGKPPAASAPATPATARK